MIIATIVAFLILVIVLETIIFFFILKDLRELEAQQYETIDTLETITEVYESNVDDLNENFERVSRKFKLLDERLLEVEDKINPKPVERVKRKYVKKATNNV